MTVTTFQVQQIQIPEIRKERMTIVIEGLTSLITNNFSEKDKEAIRNKQQKKAKVAGREAKDPEAEYRGSMYLTEDGTPGYIARGIKAACVEACRYVDDLPMTVARGAFYVMGDVLPVDREPQMREDVVKLKGTIADLRYRAEFLTPWSITFEVLFNPGIMSAAGIVNLIEIAGFHVGIGDWRPSSKKGGTHGMFQVQRGKD